MLPVRWSAALEGRTVHFVRKGQVSTVVGPMACGKGDSRAVRLSWGTRVKAGATRAALAACHASHTLGRMTKAPRLGKLRVRLKGLDQHHA